MTGTVRRATVNDAPALARFFQQAYGEHSVFTSTEYLHWFQSTCASAIGIDEAGEIVAHYGALRAQLQWGEQILEILWGVNAFTLPSARGLGLGAAVLQIVMEKAEVFGVIGFTPKTESFYRSQGFNTFGARRMHRFVRPTTSSCLDAVRWAEGDELRAHKLLGRDWPVPPPSAGVSCSAQHPLQALPVGSPSRPVLSTVRSPAHWNWRFDSRSRVSYQFWQIQRAGHPSAYAVTRRERLHPHQTSVTRIVDVAGEPEALVAVLQAVVRQAYQESQAYVDMVAFGTHFNNAFSQAGFVLLEEDDVALLPQVCAPVAARPNHEYLGLYTAHGFVADLTEADVFFTRMDSDRDRAARLEDSP